MATKGAGRRPEAVGRKLASLSSDQQNLPDYATAVVNALRASLPSDGYAVYSTDPATLLWTGGATCFDSPISGMAFLENEWLEDDFAKFNALARLGRGVTTLRRATEGAPERSRRFRRLLLPLDLRHELRAVLRVGGLCWGVLCLVRGDGRGDFTPAEMLTVEQVAPVIAAGLRGAARAPLGSEMGDTGPGTVVLDASGAIVALTPEAAYWLEQVPKDPGNRDALPQAVYAVASQAMAHARSRPGGPVRARLRSVGGGWLQVQASPLSHPAQDTTPLVAVIIEPVPPGQVAPLLADAFELSRREREVLVLLLRGYSVEEMSRSLFVSQHTVRDHVKSIYAKTGATSRAELSARALTTLGDARHTMPATPAHGRVPERSR